VRRLALVFLGISLLGVSSGSAGGERWLRYERPKLGLAITHPASWHRLDHRLTPCSNPLERIDLAGPGGALFMLQESLGKRATQGMPSRARHLGVAGAPSPLECCTATRQPGWLVVFQDGGRGFYAYLYPGRTQRRDELVAILNSLRVRAKEPPIS
jgi:hypothetical protein